MLPKAHAQEITWINNELLLHELLVKETISLLVSKEKAKKTTLVIPEINDLIKGLAIKNETKCWMTIIYHANGNKTPKLQCM